MENHVEEKEKTALIGINGAGKSTLLKIITGEEEADSGLPVLAKDAKIGYLSQHQDYHGDGSIYHAVFEVNAPLLACEEKLGLRFEDFTFLKDKEAGSFLLVLEPEKERDIAGLTALEHASLTTLATDYFREKGFGVEKVTVVFCEPEAHLLYRDMQMFKKGVLADGIAPCHISSDETVNTFFELL